MRQKIRVAVLVSGGGTNLQAIIEASRAERIDADVVVVGADHPDAVGLRRAARHGIDTFVIDYPRILKSAKLAASAAMLPEDFDLQEILSKQHLLQSGTQPEKTKTFFQARAMAESHLLAALAPFKVDLLVLAGFMRVLTPYFIDRFGSNWQRPSIMNIHPALLPAFPGTDGYGDTYRYGCKVGGCTVHFVDYGEDSGAIIAQRAFAIEETDDLAAIRQKGLALEWQIYPECIQLFAQGRLKIVKLTHQDRGGDPRQRLIVKIVSPA